MPKADDPARSSGFSQTVPSFVRLPSIGYLPDGDPKWREENRTNVGVSSGPPSWPDIRLGVALALYWLTYPVAGQDDERICNGIRCACGKAAGE